MPASAGVNVVKLQYTYVSDVTTSTCGAQFREGLITNSGAVAALQLGISPRHCASSPTTPS